MKLFDFELVVKFLVVGFFGDLKNFVDVELYFVVEKGLVVNFFFSSYYFVYDVWLMECFVSLEIDLFIEGLWILV